MSHDPGPANPIDENAALEEQLVAYLDHELDDASSRRIEQLLATDQKVRETLTRLERSWEALDELRRAEAEDAFTRTTLEMVAVAASDELLADQQKTTRRRWRRRLLGSAGLLAAGVAGFFAASTLRSHPNEELLRDLPVIENLDQYRQIDDFDFLRLLHEERLFAGEDRDGA